MIIKDENHSLDLSTISNCVRWCALRKVCSSFRYVVMNAGKSLFRTTSRNTSAAVCSLCLALQNHIKV